jgi:hypothetical protein
LHCLAGERALSLSTDLPAKTEIFVLFETEACRGCNAIDVVQVGSRVSANLPHDGARDGAGLRIRCYQRRQGAFYRGCKKPSGHDPYPDYVRFANGVQNDAHAHSGKN